MVLTVSNEICFNPEYLNRPFLFAIFYLSLPPATRLKMGLGLKLLCNIKNWMPTVEADVPCGCCPSWVRQRWGFNLLLQNSGRIVLTRGWWKTLGVGGRVAKDRHYLRSLRTGLRGSGHLSFDSYQVKVQPSVLAAWSQSLRQVTQFIPTSDSSTHKGLCPKY